MHHIVGWAAEVCLVAGNHPVGAGLKRLCIECRAHGDVLVPLPVVVGGGQIERLLPYGRQGKNGLSVGIIHPPGMGFSCFEPAEPVGLGDAKVHLRQICVTDTDRRPGLGPGAFGLDRELLGIDRCDEVSAHDTARTFGVCFGPLQGDAPGCHEIAVVVLLHEAGEVEPGQRGCLMVAGAVDERLEHRLFPVIEIGSVAKRHRCAARPEDAIEVGGQECRGVGVATMKGQQ